MSKFLFRHLHKLISSTTPCLLGHLLELLAEHLLECLLGSVLGLLLRYLTQYVEEYPFECLEKYSSVHSGSCFCMYLGEHSGESLYGDWHEYSVSPWVFKGETTQEDAPMSSQYYVWKSTPTST